MSENEIHINGTRVWKDGMFDLLSFTIPLVPISKKNSSQIFYNKASGRRFVAPSKAYRDYENQAGIFIPKNIFISAPVNVKAVYYMPTRRRVDKTNLESALLDVLVKHGLLADDNRDIVASTDGSRVMYDKGNPRTEVTITLLGKDYPIWKKVC